MLAFPCRFITCLAIIVVFGGGFQQTRAESHFEVGAEGFRDRYEEPSATVDTHTDYMSVTAQYLHDYNNFFSAVDGRYSWGKSDYKSESGVLNGTPEFETDLRLREGVDLTWWHGKLMPYIGVGWRYYFDEGKGGVTSLGRLAYDRHISQVYVPLGATYQFTSGNWVFSPMLELDTLVYGRVSSHLAAIGADSDLHNTQHRGYGFRSEFMVGQQYKYFNWQAGPFVRYWRVDPSDCKVTLNSPPGECGEEPKNTRLQGGAALRIGF